MAAVPQTADTSIVAPEQEVAPVAPCTDAACVRELITLYAKRYGVNREIALLVARCESEFKTTAVGDGGKAYGVYQFHKPTFREFAAKSGEEGLEYKDPEDSIKLAMWAFSTGRADHWSCYGKVKQSLANR